MGSVVVCEILPALNTAVLPPFEDFRLCFTVVALYLIIGGSTSIVRNNLSRVVCERCPTQCHGYLSDRIKEICAQK